MAVKKVQVEVKQGEGFRTECKAGNHVVIIDQPAPGGTDGGPSPLEVQLMALGGCIAAIGRIVAKQKKLTVRGFEIALEADIDTEGLLGRPGKRVGFSAINVHVKIDADMSETEKAQYLHEVDSRCPISDILQHATPVSVTLVS